MLFFIKKNFMLRILIIIFTLNIFVSPTMATVCNMMDDVNMSSVPHNMSNHAMSDDDKGCEMSQNNSCSSTECITGCAVNCPLLLLNNGKFFIVKGTEVHSKDNLLSLYETIFPVNPPPLI